MDVSLSIVGDRRDLHPVLRDEIYRIGYEAIRNACRHSTGRAVDVRLEYAHDLTVRVRDDGVGIDPSVLEQGKDGHRELQNFIERSVVLTKGTELYAPVNVPRHRRVGVASSTACRYGAADILHS